MPLRTRLDQIRRNAITVSGMLTPTTIADARDMLPPEPHEAYGNAHMQLLWQTVYAYYKHPYKMHGIEFFIHEDLPDDVVILQSKGHHVFGKYPELDEMNFAVIRGFITTLPKYQ